MEKLKQFFLLLLLFWKGFLRVVQGGAKPHISASTSVCGLPAYTTTISAFTPLHCPPPMHLFQSAPYPAASLPRSPRD